MRKTRPSDESNVKCDFLNLLICSLLHAAAAADGVCFAQMAMLDQADQMMPRHASLSNGTWRRCGPNSALAAVHMGGGGGGVPMLDETRYLCWTRLKVTTCPRTCCWPRTHSYAMVRGDVAGLILHWPLCTWVGSSSPAMMMMVGKASFMGKVKHNHHHVSVQ